MVYGAPNTTGIRSTVNGTFFCPNYFPALRVPMQVVRGQVCLFSVVIWEGGCRALRPLLVIYNVPVVLFVQIPMIESFSVELLGGSVTNAPVL